MNLQPKSIQTPSSMLKKLNESPKRLKKICLSSSNYFPNYQRTDCDKTKDDTFKLATMN